MKPPRRVKIAVVIATVGLVVVPVTAANSGKGNRMSRAAHADAEPGKNAPGRSGKNTPVVSAQTDQGVVQSVSGGGLVLRALDGSSVGVAVTNGTQVLVDGKHGLLRDIRPGFVAIVSWSGSQSAQTVEAFDLLPQSGESLAVVQSVVADGVAVTTADGRTATIHVNARTRVFVDGEAATLADVKPGFTLVTSAAVRGGGKPAAQLLFLRQD